MAVHGSACVLVCVCMRAYVRACVCVCMHVGVSVCASACVCERIMYYTHYAELQNHVSVYLQQRKVCV